MQNEKAITTLNGLIEICRNGEEGFRTAAEGMKDPSTKSVFLEYSRQRGQMVRELQNEVRRLGGAPEDTGSLSGSLHRGWMNIKSLVTGGSESSIVAEAERGEDVAKKAYEEAERETLPPTTLTLIRQQAAIVREAHDRVRALEQRVTK